MAENTPPPDEAQTKEKFKQWINEALNEREAKAAADEAERKKQEDADAEKARANKPFSFLDSLIGKLG